MLSQPKHASKHEEVVILVSQRPEKLITGQGWQDFSVKGQILNIIGFASQMVSVIATELCRCTMKATMSHKRANQCGCIPASFIHGYKILNFITCSCAVKYYSSLASFQPSKSVKRLLARKLYKHRCWTTLGSGTRVCWPLMSFKMSASQWSHHSRGTTQESIQLMMAIFERL